MSYTKEQLREIFRGLPEEVQEAIFSVETADSIKKIGDTYKLHIDQMGDLASLTGEVMLGILPPQDFLGALEKTLNIPIETAGEIVKDVNTAIFFPVREQLKKVHRLEPTSAEKYRPEQAPLVESAIPQGNITPESIKKENTSASSVPNNAIIIDKPVPETPAVNPSEQLFQKKMEKLFTLPKEEKIANAAPTNLTAPSKPHDPYREPIS